MTGTLSLPPPKLLATCQLMQPASAGLVWASCAHAEASACGYNHITHWQSKIPPLHPTGTVITAVPTATSAGYCQKRMAKNKAVP